MRKISDFFKFCVFLRKSELYLDLQPTFLVLESFFNHQQVVLSNQASALYLIHLKLFLGGVHKLRLQDEVLLEISTVYRFALITVKKFLHEFQHGVGRWSKRPKSCQRSWRMPPYSFLLLERFVVGENGSFCMSQRVKVNSEEKSYFD